MAPSATVYVIGGPAGTGKSTIGEMLSQKIGSPFVEGDAYHPPANIAKMSRGIALTDDDRWGWLKELSEISAKKCLEEGNLLKTTIVTCSMLKKAYREYIKKSATVKAYPQDIVFRFVFLYASFDDLMNRVGGRQGHFMKSDMVKSQYETMEIPRENELLENGGDCVAIDTVAKLPQQVFEAVLTSLALNQAKTST